MNGMLIKVRLTVLLVAAEELLITLEVRAAVEVMSFGHQCLSYVFLLVDDDAVVVAQFKLDYIAIPLA